MDRKVNTAYLKIGMYVSKLDRPWIQTPFLIQGFFIEDESEINELVKHCDFVYIDTDRGVKADMYFDLAASIHAKQSLTSNKQVESILDTEKRPLIMLIKAPRLKSCLRQKQR